MITMAALKLALSRMPMTSTTVMIPAITRAGRSMRVPVAASWPVAGLESKGGIGQPMRQFDAENADEILEVVGPTMRDSRGPHCVFEHEIPADDPGKQLAERRVGVSVSRASDGNH